MLNSLPQVPNLPEIENKWLKFWEKNNIYEKYLKKNENSNRKFSFIDGPITANNKMGVHHGWGRTLKDLWQKFHNLQGEKQRFQNGFDCQGLWVEVEVEKELNLKTKKDIENLIPNDKEASIAKFVNLCKERVLKFSKIQAEQSIRLGYFMNWDNSYYTMSDENNYMIWHFLKVCHENGWIYKGKDSVPWCPRCQTAISQHEMLTEDYKEVYHESVYLELPIRDRKNEYLLVWTTTPWTIPANIAVAVDKKLDYSLVLGTSSDSYWVAKELINTIFGKDYQKIIKTVKGTELVGLRYNAPFDYLPAVQKIAKENEDKFHIVVETDPLILPITTTEGTGLVHTAVSAGSEDFKLGKKLGLPLIPVIDDEANYLEGFAELSQKNAKKHPRLILDYLNKDNKNKNWVFKIVNYKHRYPACWRCKTELVWKVADEWYIAMDRPEKKQNETFRQKMISVAKEIKWNPEFGLDRELDWLNNMHDWLISKPNRYWGLALPIYECTNCNYVTVIGSKEELQQKAVMGWEAFKGNSPHKPWIDAVKIECPQCHQTVARLPDVGNVWLDAGIVPFSSLIDPKTKKLSFVTDKKYWKEWFPANVISESFPGQFKNWFYSLIAMSAVLTEKPSFKTVLGYASCLGEDGRAMHKSAGNSIEFNEAADKVGADVMRWLFVKQDPTKNLLFGFNALIEIRRQFHIPLWNILKFYLTYVELDSWNKTTTKNSSYGVLDQWILSRLNETINTVQVNVTLLNPHIASQAIETFVTDLSQWYIRESRDRVWNNNTNQEDKNNFYQTLNMVLHKLTIILSPFLPFFSEEIYSFLKLKQSVHLEEWPNTPSESINLDLHKDMILLRQITEEAHGLRKEAKLKVRQPLNSITVNYPLNSLKINKNIPEYEKILLNELNLKKVVWKKNKSEKLIVKLDTKLTEELVEEGKIRDLIRKIQEMRKTENYQVNDKIVISIPKIIPKYLSLVKQKTLASKVELNLENKIIISRE